MLGAEFEGEKGRGEAVLRRVSRAAGLTTPRKTQRQAQRCKTSDESSNLSQGTSLSTQPLSILKKMWPRILLKDREMHAFWKIAWNFPGFCR